MKIMKKNLFSLISSLLSEGKSEDLVAQYPQLRVAYDQGVRKEVYLRWLLRMEKWEPISDIFPLIFALEKNKQRLPIKDIGKYENPNDLRRALEDLGSGKTKQAKMASSEDTDVIYEDEQWIVVVPITQESSVLWGKDTTWCTAATQSENMFYDYITDSKLGDIILFYIIRKDGNSRKNPKDKMSIGFLNNRIDESKNYGGLTVDASNAGIDLEDLEDVLGDKFLTILSQMTKYSNENKGTHPIKTKMIEILRFQGVEEISKFMEKQSDDSFRKLFNIFFNFIVNYELSAWAINYFAKKCENISDIWSIVNLILSRERELVDQREIMEDAISHVFFNHSDYADIEALCLQSQFLSEKILEDLSRKNNSFVINLISTNKNCSEEALRRIFKSTLTYHYEDEIKIKENLSLNPKTPPDVIESIARSENLTNDAKMLTVLLGIAKNPKTPTDVLEDIIDSLRQIHDNVGTFSRHSPANKALESIASNRALNKIQFEKLLSLDMTNAIVIMAKNPGCPDSILRKIAQKEIDSPREWKYSETFFDSINYEVVSNPNTSGETLDMIVRHDMSDTLRAIAANHPNISGETLNFLYNLNIRVIRDEIEKNPKWKNFSQRSELNELWLKIFGKRKTER